VSCDDADGTPSVNLPGSCCCLIGYFELLCGPFRFLLSVSPLQKRGVLAPLKYKSMVYLKGNDRGACGLLTRQHPLVPEVVAQLIKEANDGGKLACNMLPFKCKVSEMPVMKKGTPCMTPIPKIHAVVHMSTKMVSLFIPAPVQHQV